MNPMGCDQIFYENPLVSINKAGYETPYFSGKYVGKGLVD